jgi:hypothetical protein
MSASVCLRRGTLAASLGVFLVVTQAQAQADRVMETGRTPRRYVLPFVGAAIGGAASLVYFWSGPRTLPGTCSQAACVAAFSLGGGAFIGWLVGKEKDELHELRYRGGRPLRPGASSLILAGEPIRLSTNGSLVAATGSGGVHVISTVDGKLVGTRAAGLRNISDAALLQADNELAVTASGGFYKFPLNTGLGALLRSPPATAVIIVGDAYAVAAGTRVERIPRTAIEPTDYRGVEVGDTVHALRLDQRGNIWAVTNTEVLALRPAADSFAIISRTRVPRGATRIDVEGDLAAVALSDSGVRFLNVASPESPSLIADWRGTKFVADVALSGGKAFIAANMDGVAVVTLVDGKSPRLDGLARELGLVVAVIPNPPYLFVLDRGSTAAVRRVLISELIK